MIKVSSKSDDDWRETLKEIGLLKTCRHSNIIQFYDAFSVGRKIWIVMEYASGTCMDILDVLKTPFDEESIASVAVQVLRVCTNS